MSYVQKQDRPEPISPEEYLRLEKAADTKSEYIDGQVYAMSGASIEHNRLATDTTVILGILLRDSKCNVYGSDLRVRVEGRRGIFYPDLSVVCGDESVDPDDCLHNPVALIEILSHSTEKYDRVKKWLLYQQISSLKIYILISQDKILIEIFERKEENADWIYRNYSQREDLIFLDALGIEVPIAEIYRRVVFSEPDDSDAA
jgi:Uma2 family endonuclease